MKGDARVTPLRKLDARAPLAIRKGCWDGDFGFVIAIEGDGARKPHQSTEGCRESKMKRMKKKRLSPSPELQVKMRQA